MGVAARLAPKGLGPQKSSKKLAHSLITLVDMLSRNWFFSILRPWPPPLTNVDLGTIQYVSSQLNGLNIHDGCIPYTEIEQILTVIDGYQIYTFSDLAVTTLRRYLPNTRKIKNIQDMGFEMPKNLPTSHCFRSHRSRYCAKSKAREVRDFMRYFDWEMKLFIYLPFIHYSIQCVLLI